LAAGHVAWKAIIASERVLVVALLPAQTEVEAVTAAREQVTGPQHLGTHIGITAVAGAALVGIEIAGLCSDHEVDEGRNFLEPPFLDDFNILEVAIRQVEAESSSTSQESWF
jgi:hypothetical protein